MSWFILFNSMISTRVTQRRYLSVQALELDIDSDSPLLSAIGERLPDGRGNPHAKYYYYRICTSFDDLSILTRIGSLQEIYNLLFVPINTADLRLLTYTTFHYLLQRLIKLENFRFPFCISRTTMNWSWFWRMLYSLLFFRKLETGIGFAPFVRKTLILLYKRNGCNMFLLCFTVPNCLMRFKFIIFLMTAK